MSVIVNYKGSTLTTIAAGGTKTLNTSGKYMEDNVQITDTTSYTATISGSGNSNYCYVTYEGTKRYTNGTTFNFSSGDILTIYTRANNAYINGTKVTTTSYTYSYTLPAGDITINLTYSSSSSNSVYIYTTIMPTGTTTISSSGTHDVYTYSQATVAAGSAFPPSVTITNNPTFSMNSLTGVVTASYTGSSSITPTVTSGYISQGTAGIISTTGTSTYQLTTQAAQTINTSTADQTIASNKWLTGTQTIKSVTTSNLIADNIAEGVVVKVGDANNASRITQITGTYGGASSYTATIAGSGNSSYCYVTYNGTKYYSNNGTFTFKAGDTLTIYSRGNSVTINGDTVTLSSYTYTYTLPSGDITISLTYSSSTNNSIKIWGLIQPSGTYSVTTAGTHDVYKYSIASVATGSAFPPAVTITKNPTFSIVSSTGVVTASYTGSSSITPTVTSGWVSQGTAGTVSTTGTSTYQLTTQAAQTITPTTTSQYINSYRWLTGSQTIAPIPSSYVIPTGTSTITSNGTYDVKNYASASVNVAGGEYYGIYRAIANGAGINSNGSSTYSYTSTDVINWCNTWSVMRSNCLTGVSLTGSFNFSNVSQMIGPNFAYAPAWNLNNPGAYSINFPILTNISAYAFYYNSGISAINGNKVTTIGSNAFGYCRKLSSINFPVCTSIGESAFYNCLSLTTANFPSCTTIESSVFYYCESLTTVSFPVCTTIGGYAFCSCSALTIASFPACTSIKYEAFYSCLSLTTANFPVCTSISDAAFYSCVSLTTISFPLCTTIGSSAFYYCTSLTTASFPSCTTIGNSAFYYCTSLTTVSFPLCTTIGSYAFYNCMPLTTVSFPSCTTIAGYAFAGCYNLLSLYLLGSSMVSLANTTALRSTPISNYTTSTGGVYGSIFVPASLYNSYRTATNWVSYSARIVSV